MSSRIEKFSAECAGDLHGWVGVSEADKQRLEQYFLQANRPKDLHNGNARDLVYFMMMAKKKVLGPVSKKNQNARARALERDGCDYAVTSDILKPDSSELFETLDSLRADADGAVDAEGKKRIERIRERTIELVREMAFFDIADLYEKATIFTAEIGKGSGLTGLELGDLANFMGSTRQLDVTIKTRIILDIIVNRRLAIMGCAIRNLPFRKVFERVERLEEGMTREEIFEEGEAGEKSKTEILLGGWRCWPTVKEIAGIREKLTKVF